MRAASLAALALAAALAAGCGPTRRVLTRTPEPSAAVTSMKTQAFDRQRADLRLQLEVENPGPALTLVAADYEILAQGRSFATGTVAVELAVAEGGRASLTLPVQLAYLDLPYLARNRVKAGQRVQLVARGRLRGTAGAAPASIEFDGEADVGLTIDALP